MENTFSESLKSIMEEFESLKGQFVITDGWKIERLVAIGEDEHDYYYVTYNGRKLRWNTCVGKVVPLKGYIREEDYLEFCRIARLNHFDHCDTWGHPNIEEAKRLKEKHKAEVIILDKRDKLLTEICWDIV
jgi:hypothetical protein